MFLHEDEKGYLQVLDGIKRKTLAFGEKTLMTKFLLDKGANLPLHGHPQEQTGFLVSGHIRLTIGNETHDIYQGDSWSIPADVMHGAAIVEDSAALEVFSPVREDYLP